MKESDPYGYKPNEPGAKLDGGKSPVRRGLLEYFPRACLAVAQVSASGASKYSWKGWETVPDGVDRYGDAEVRHICKAAIEGSVDHDYGHLHATHEAWNSLARLELILKEQENAIKPNVDNPRSVAVRDVWKDPMGSTRKTTSQDQKNKYQALQESSSTSIHADNYLVLKCNAGSDGGNVGGTGTGISSNCTDYDPAGWVTSTPSWMSLQEAMEQFNAKTRMDNALHST